MSSVSSEQIILPLNSYVSENDSINTEQWAHNVKTILNMYETYKSKVSNPIKIVHFLSKLIKSDYSETIIKDLVKDDYEYTDADEYADYKFVTNYMINVDYHDPSIGIGLEKVMIMLKDLNIVRPNVKSILVLMIFINDEISDVRLFKTFDAFQIFIFNESKYMSDINYCDPYMIVCDLNRIGYFYRRTTKLVLRSSIV